MEEFEYSPEYHRDFFCEYGDDTYHLNLPRCVGYDHATIDLLNHRFGKAEIVSEPTTGTSGNMKIVVRWEHGFFGEINYKLTVYSKEKIVDGILIYFKSVVPDPYPLPLGETFKITTTIHNCGTENIDSEMRANYLLAIRELIPVDEEGRQLEDIEPIRTDKESLKIRFNEAFELLESLNFSEAAIDDAFNNLSRIFYFRTNINLPSGADQTIIKEVETTTVDPLLQPYLNDLFNRFETRIHLEEILMDTPDPNRIIAVSFPFYIWISN